MHANVQTRFNPAIGEKAPYYRLKESYRDVRGNVHSLILLNVGFDPSIDALQAKKIARALIVRTVYATSEHTGPQSIASCCL